MKKTLASCAWLGLLVLVNICGATRADYASEPESDIYKVPVGFHEFEIFGDKAIYLSHYPMFGSIHSYQVLVEVTLKSSGTDDPKQLYLAHKQKNPDARYSVSPANSSGEPDYWVLPEVIQVGNRFERISTGIFSILLEMLQFKSRESSISGYLSPATRNRII